MNIEQKHRVFNGGEEEGQFIDIGHAFRILVDALQTMLYNNVSTRVVANKADRKYTDNKSFWSDALLGRHFPSAYIILDDFNLMEWLPFSPGRYYTRNATWQRENCARNFSYSLNEYLPDGKSSMIHGGIGTIRLTEKSIDGHKIYFLGASSSGIAHQGIPVALPSGEYRKVISQIREHGGCQVKLVGYLQSLTEEMPSLNFNDHIPRYCLFVEEVIVKKVSNPENLLVTVAAMFTSKKLEHHSNFHPIHEKSWTFYSFNPSSSQRNIHTAAEWIVDYADRYSNGASSILTDFDEHYRLFPCPVEFPLPDIVRGRVDWDTLRLYTRHFQGTYIDTYIEKLMGDKISVTGSGNTIVNRSLVQNAFNKVKSEYDEATASALTRVEEEINKSGNQEAADNFNSFNEELQKPEPKKSILKTMWQGTIAALPTLKALTDVVVTITKLFT